MTPFDGYFNPLPPNPVTVLRGFASITKHLERQHRHAFYEVNYLDLSIVNDSQQDSIEQYPCVSAEEKITEKKVSGQFSCCFDSIIIPAN